MVGEIALLAAPTPLSWATPTDGNYARTLVYCDPSGMFDVWCLAWATGSRSPMHDHAELGCHMKVLEGEVREETSNGTVTVLSPASGSRFIHNRYHTHRVSCDSSHAVTLHLYSPGTEVAIGERRVT